MSYDGPGVYRHYKGGLYGAIGVAEHETTGQKTVIYRSFDGDRTAARLARGVDYINRPLNEEDGADAWNSQAICPFCDHGIAGGKPCEFEHCSDGLIAIERFTKTETV